MTEQDAPENNTANTATSIVVDCDLDASPEKVWRALTEPELLAQWLMPAQMRPETGECFSFHPANGNDAVSRGPIDCEVLAAEPQRLLRYSWRGPADERDAGGRRLDTVVTFLLAETAEGGTHLRVIHSGFPRPLSMGPGRQPVLMANSNVEAGLRLAA